MMKKWAKWAALAAVLCVLSGCVTPRTSTEQERADLNAMLTTVEMSLTVLVANQNIKHEEFSLAMRQVADLRQLVEESETRAVGWPDLTMRVANLAAQWAVGAPAPEVRR